MVWRITDRATFASLRQSRRRAGVGPVRAVFVPRDDDVAYVAYAVSRRAGGAVVRNRIRRRLRAVVAAAEGIRPGAYLLSAGPAAATMPFPELVATVRRAMAKAASR